MPWRCRHRNSALLFLLVFIYLPYCIYILSKEVSDKTDFGNDRKRSLQWNSPLASEIWLCQVKSSCRTVKLPYWAVAVVKTVCKNDKQKFPINLIRYVNQSVGYKTKMHQSLTGHLMHFVYLTIFSNYWRLHTAVLNFQFPILHFQFINWERRLAVI